MAPAAALAADLTLLGDWSKALGTQDLSGGAGTDFPAAFESSATQATIDVTNTGGAAWTLWVRQDQAMLPPAVGLSVRRSSDGSGQGSISGGSAYLTPDFQEQILCSGVGDRSGIGLQFRLSGISISQPPGSFGATLGYRVD
ncbi:hypothetical protein F2Q65_16650 [Thiohalocapsa marina]|uniref:Uncharacterized protein n=2 Tax=Thiohalocapsa marina TaxID=424902 RepID=A0A5M8FH18_9GAMM|nr:hypothetical protein F2Q65_16650 [Thiohalocapsa marina]